MPVPFFSLVTVLRNDPPCTSCGCRWRLALVLPAVARRRRHATTAKALAVQWFDLFRSFAGDDPATQQKIRLALENEPALRQGGMVDDRMRDFIRAAMQALRAQPAP